MKKVLLTSTALVAFAGAAAADISLSGTAKMGIAGGTNDATIASVDGDTDNEFVGEEISLDLPAQFYQDVDVTFTMTGETDGGLAFGVSVDLDEAGNLGNEFDDQGVAVFISGDFGTVTLGDTDGALDFVIPESGYGSGSLNDAETSHFGYLGSFLDGSGDGQIVRYDYTFDAFTFAASIEQGASGAGGLVREDDEDLTWAVGVGYDWDFGGGSLATGLGYQYSDDGELDFTFGGEDDSSFDVIVGSGEVAAWAIGAQLNMDNGLSAGLVYTNYDFEDADDAINHWMVGIGYEFDAFNIGANYGVFEDGDTLADGWGISAGYDLGGGAQLVAGYGYGSADSLPAGAFNVDGEPGDESVALDDVDISIYSVGLLFSF